MTMTTNTATGIGRLPQSALDGIRQESIHNRHGATTINHTTHKIYGDLLNEDYTPRNINGAALISSINRPRFSSPMMHFCRMVADGLEGDYRGMVERFKLHPEFMPECAGDMRIELMYWVDTYHNRTYWAEEQGHPNPHPWGYGEVERMAMVMEMLLLHPETQAMANPVDALPCLGDPEVPSLVPLLGAAQQVLEASEARLAAQAA